MKCKKCGSSNVVLGSKGAVDCENCDNNPTQLDLGLQFQPKSDDPYHDLVCVNQYSAN